MKVINPLFQKSGKQGNGPLKCRPAQLIFNSFKRYTAVANLNAIIDGYEKDMVSTMSEMVAIKSISPASGGAGEKERADYLESLLESMGFKIVRYDYKDESGAVRSNLVVRYGNTERTIWIVSHIDTVSEGDMKLWNSDPFKATIVDGKIYGRGTVDDGQSAVGSIYALKALKESGAELKYNFGLVLVADEEVGSKYGIQKLLEEGIFKKSDMFLVPDWGTPDGKMIEVAEKSIMWLKITVNGQQVHASTPDDGVNAYRYSIMFLSRAYDLLHDKYNAGNAMFKPTKSTFEMTKHEKNVDSINIIPGMEVCYLDCRVLPQYTLDDVMKDIEGIAAGPDFQKVKISFEAVQREEAAPPTSENAEIVRLLKRVMKEQRGIDAGPIGIGGGTCAGFFRRAGFESAVWFTCDDIAHQPNEFLVIKNMVDDAKVFAGLFI